MVNVQLLVQTCKMNVSDEKSVQKQSRTRRSLDSKGEVSTTTRSSSAYHAVDQHECTPSDAMMSFDNNKPVTRGLEFMHRGEGPHISSTIWAGRQRRLVLTEKEAG